MAKFNVTVDIDWMEDETTVDDVIRTEVVGLVAAQIKDKIVADVENGLKAEVDKIISDAKQTISNNLDSMMGDFFDAPRDITDRWGEVKVKNTTIREMLKDECDKFMIRKVDKNTGKLYESDGWSSREAVTRSEYMVAQIVEPRVKMEIESAVKKAYEQVKAWTKASLEKQLGQEMAKAIGVDQIVSEMISKNS